MVLPGSKCTSLILAIPKLFADSRSSYLAVVSKILNCSLNAVRDERMDDEYRCGRDHQDTEPYNPDYMASRKEEEAAAYTEDVMISEHPTFSSSDGIDLQPTIEIGQYLDEGRASEPSSGHR